MSCVRESFAGEIENAATNVIMHTVYCTIGKSQGFRCRKMENVIAEKPSVGYFTFPQTIFVNSESHPLQTGNFFTHCLQQHLIGAFVIMH